MLFNERYWPGIADGSITLAFRRWTRPTVRAGGNLRSPGGYLAIDAVDIVAEAEITEDDAHRAGFASRAELISELDYRRDASIYRIAFHLAGTDPRDALRERSDLTDQDVATIRTRLDRLDCANTEGPWTSATLDLIGQGPGTRAAALAAALGEPDLQRFKGRVRKLKALGLTESLAVGYRLSPRGKAYINAVDQDRSSDRALSPGTERSRGRRKTGQRYT